MKRIFLEDEISENITISGNDARHLAYSLRAKKGDRIIAVDRSGNTATIELTEFDREKISAKCIGEIKKVESSETIKIIHRVGKKNEVETHQRPMEKIFKKSVTLAECLPKQNKFDIVVEKATELGVDKISPLISDRTIARPGNFRAKTKLDRWTRIAKEAAEQSARDTIPKIENICELMEWLKEIEPTLGHFVKNKKDKKVFDCKGSLLLFCYEKENEQTIQEILREYKISDCHKNIIILIGPEGGFSEREVREIKSAGGVSVSLGKRILKTDTAAISTLAAVQYELN
ncbi:MAG: 16S rRNA (uracil(1498)-N(3))-methyltransferase [Selenomonadaceae bacterium]|nr:16S rRNA (uracil(1498)-N(3))-methyltransferase [Selenomonadaceae bacterium]